MPAPQASPAYESPRPAPHTVPHTTAAAAAVTGKQPQLQNSALQRLQPQGDEKEQQLRQQEQEEEQQRQQQWQRRQQQLFDLSSTYGRKAHVPQPSCSSPPPPLAVRPTLSLPAGVAAQGGAAPPAAVCNRSEELKIQCAGVFPDKLCSGGCPSEL